MRLAKWDLLVNSTAWGGAGVTEIPALISVKQPMWSWTGSSLLQDKLLGKPVRRHLDGSESLIRERPELCIHPEQPPSHVQLPSQPYEPEQGVPPQPLGLQRQMALFQLNQQQKKLPRGSVLQSKPPQRHYEQQIKLHVLQGWEMQL